MRNPVWHIQDILRCPRSFEASARQRYLQSQNLKLRDEQKDKILSVLFPFILHRKFFAFDAIERVN
jgi:hypothetical protein